MNKIAICTVLTVFFLKLSAVSGTQKYLRVEQGTGSCTFPGYNLGGDDVTIELVTSPTVELEDTLLKEILESAGTATGVLSGVAAGSAIGKAMTILGGVFGGLAATQPQMSDLKDAVDEAINELTERVNEKLTDMRAYVDQEIVDLEESIMERQYKMVFHLWANCILRDTVEGINECSENAYWQIAAEEYSFLTYKEDLITSASEVTDTETVSSSGYHLAPAGSHECDYGISASQSDCEAAALSVAPDPKSSMNTGSGGTCLDGSWGQVPLGCSSQTGGQNTAHYKTSGDTGAGCIHENYQLVCSEETVTYDDQYIWSLEVSLPIFREYANLVIIALSTLKITYATTSPDTEKYDFFSERLTESVDLFVEYAQKSVARLLEAYNEETCTMSCTTSTSTEDWSEGSDICHKMEFDVVECSCHVNRLYLDYETCTWTGESGDGENTYANPSRCGASATGTAYWASWLIGAETCDSDDDCESRIKEVMEEKKTSNNAAGLGYIENYWTNELLALIPTWQVVASTEITDTKKKRDEVENMEILDDIKQDQDESATEDVDGKVDPKQHDEKVKNPDDEVEKSDEKIINGLIDDVMASLNG